MFKMFAIICVVTVMDCRTMYEDPPRTFDTMQECEAEQTLDMLTVEGELTVEHFEVGGEKIED